MKAGAMTPAFIHSSLEAALVGGDRFGAARAGTDVGDRHAGQLFQPVEVGTGGGRQVSQLGAPADVIGPPGQIFVDGHGAVDVALVVRHLGAALAVDLVLR